MCGLGPACACDTTWDRVTVAGLSRSEQNKCEAGQASKQGPWCHLLWVWDWSRGHQDTQDTAWAINTYSRRHAPPPSRCFSHSMDHPGFFQYSNFCRDDDFVWLNCENISMALHRTKLRDLAETAKVVSGRKFIRNSGEICSLHHKIEDRWARSYSGQASPDLRLSLWLCTKPHSSIAIQLKRSKSSISFWTEKLFYQGFPRSKQLDCETMSFITQAVMVGTGDTQQRIL